MIHLNSQVDVSHNDVVWICSTACVGLAIRLNCSLRGSSSSLRHLACSILSGIIFKVALFPLVSSRTLLLDLGWLHHHSLLSPLVLTRPSSIVSSVLPKVNFVQIVVPRIHVLYLVLNIVNLTHVNWLVQQMLPFDLLFVESIGGLAGSWVVARPRLGWRDGRLLVVVLTHYADLFGFLQAFSWLLDGWSLLLGRGHSLLVLSWAMATDQLHLGLDLAKNFVHAAHGIDRCVHCAVCGILIKIISLRLLVRGTCSCGWSWVLLNFAFTHRIMTRFSIARGASNTIVLGLKMIEHIDMACPNIIVRRTTDGFLVRDLSWVCNALLTTWLRWSIHVLRVSPIRLRLGSRCLVWGYKTSSCRHSQRVVEINWGLIIIIVLMPWLQLAAVIFLKQVLGHALQSFLVLRDVLVDVLNLTRLYWLLRNFLYFHTTSLSTFWVLMVVLLAQDLHLRRYGVVTYLALIIVFLILSEQIL